MTHKRPVFWLGIHHCCTHTAALLMRQPGTRCNHHITWLCMTQAVCLAYAATPPGPRPHALSWVYSPTCPACAWAAQSSLLPKVNKCCAGEAHDGGRKQEASKSHAQGIQRDRQRAGGICAQAGQARHCTPGLLLS